MADGALPIGPPAAPAAFGAEGRIAGGTIIPAAIGPPGALLPTRPLPIPTADTKACVSLKLLVCCTPDRADDSTSHSSRALYTISWMCEMTLVNWLTCFIAVSASKLFAWKTKQKKKISIFQHNTARALRSIFTFCSCCNILASAVGSGLVRR